MALDQDFLESLTQPTHRRLYSHWCDCAPAGRLPGRPHLNFKDLEDLRPWIGEIEVVRDQARLFFRHRHCGQALTAKHKQDPSGLWFEETYAGYQLELARVTHVQVVAMKRPEVARFSQSGGPEGDLTDERLILPLATDGEIVDALIYLPVFTFG